MGTLQYERWLLLIAVGLPPLTVLISLYSIGAPHDFAVWQSALLAIPTLALIESVCVSAMQMLATNHLTTVVEWLISRIVTVPQYVFIVVYMLTAMTTAATTVYGGGLAIVVVIIITIRTIRQLAAPNVGVAQPLFGWVWSLVLLASISGWSLVFVWVGLPIVSPQFVQLMVVFSGMIVLVQWFQTHQRFTIPAVVCVICVMLIDRVSSTNIMRHMRQALQEILFTVCAHHLNYAIAIDDCRKATILSRHLQSIIHIKLSSRGAM